jgi:hypothetical protein
MFCISAYCILVNETNTREEVSYCPEMMYLLIWVTFLPGIIELFEVIVEFIPEYLGWSSFEVSECCWNICSNGKWEEAMYMIWLTSNSEDIDVPFFAYSSEDDSKTFYHGFSEYLTSIFGYPDKMSCEVIGSMRGVVIVKWMFGGYSESFFWLLMCHTYTQLYSSAIDSIFTIGLKSSNAGVLTQLEQRYVVPVYVGASV